MAVALRHQVSHLPSSDASGGGGCGGAGTRLAEGRSSSRVALGGEAKRPGLRRENAVKACARVQQRAWFSKKRRGEKGLRLGGCCGEHSLHKSFVPL